MAMAREKGPRSFSISTIAPTFGALQAMTAGEERYIASDPLFRARMKKVLPHCDLIVGDRGRILIGSGETVLGVSRSDGALGFPPPPSF